MAKKKTAKKKSTPKGASTTKSTRTRGQTSTTKRKTTSKKVATTSSKKVAKKVAKKTTKKKVVKKPAAKVSKASKKKASTSKTVAKKSAKKSTPTTASKVAKKTKKKTTKKVAKKVTKKVSKKVSKKTTKKTAKPDSGSTAKPKKTSSKSKKSASGEATTKAESPKAETTTAPVKAAESSGASSGAKDSSGPPKKRRANKAKKAPLVLPTRPLLLGPNGPSLKPLIPSGTKVSPEKSVLDNVTSRRTKTPLTKTQLEHYRQILLTKRAELLGDMRNLEDEALRNDSGSLSHSSQHLAEQGSESYEQTLNLNLAASDRERIKEIDDALQRIADRTYGLCMLTFEPIKKARLDELPWAKYTIHAARELDRRGGKH